ncbi:restriction endonuclease subunit S [Tenacibaculum sp. SDUM215027]|uniref:restriction endonuclease subunit S n=1 Tax=Tenacibaculum sp. SDUM215027 TaxID=3422596 RepID=UPI003D32422D
MENTNLKPAVRFPEFTENWKPNVLGKLENINFLKGKGISKADIVDDGKTECIRYGELYTIYDEVIDKVYSKTNLPTSELVLSNANDVIIPASGETQIDIATASCVLRDDIALSGDLNIIRSEINGVFLSYYLNNKKKKAIARLAQGSSVIHLYNPHLKTLKLNLPIPDEQKRIADFLTSIEIRISSLKEKKDTILDFKKGVMQKIFNQDIRFKDDNGNDFPDWDEKVLGKVFSGLKGKGISKDKIVENGKNECILYGELYTKYPEIVTEVISYTNSNEGVKSKEGDLLIPASTTTTAIDLANVTAILKEDVLLGGDINILRKKEKLDSAFFAYYLSNHYKTTLAKYAQGITIVHLYFSHLKKVKILVPKIKEQTKIANYLIAIDTYIEELQKKINVIEDFKKGLLQKMFV